MSQNTQLKNENIDLTIEKLPHCRVIFSLIISSKAAQAAKESAIRNVAKEVNIPGFRKGKAPRDLIIQKYKNPVDQETREIMTRTAINEAVRFSNIHPYSANAKMKLNKFESKENGEYFLQFEFETHPDVPTIDLKNFKVSDVVPETVNEAAVEKKLEDIRLRQANWEEIKDRPATEGDYIILDIDELSDEEPVPLHKDTRFHLKGDHMPKWAKDIVTGLSIGESKEGTSAPESKEEEENFQPRNVRFTLKTIQKANLSEINDEFAKKSGAESVTALKEAIQKSLVKESSNFAKNKQRAEAKNFLLKNYSFELPGERLKTLHDECHAIAERETAQWKTHEEMHEYAHQMQAEAEQSIRFSYLLGKVFNDYKINPPTAEEIRQRATEYYLMRYMRGETNLKEDDFERLTKLAENDIMAEKALDYLIDHSKSA